MCQMMRIWILSKASQKTNDGPAWEDYLVYEKCDLVTKFSTCLTRHARMKHCDGRYNCEVCNKEYNTSEQVKFHMRAYNLIVIVVIISHLNPCTSGSFSHARNVRIKYKGSSKKNFVHVMNKHDGIYFKCSDCVYKANNKGALAVHDKS